MKLSVKLLRLFGVVGLVLAAAVLVACSDDDDDGDTASNPTATTAAASAATSTTSAPAPTATTAAAAATATTPAGGGGQATTVTMIDFGYQPATLTVSPGAEVSLNVINGGNAPHTFTITNLVDSGNMTAGQTRTVTFTAPASGTLTYFCTIHSAARMSGTITVQ